jgi:uncharacterized protein
VPLHRLDAEHLREVVHDYRDALRQHQEMINRLNVYPVPDGDTGTNMALTLESVCQELAATAADGSDVAVTCRAISHGSLMGARGNSGVILSQVLRGMADVLREQYGDGADGAAGVEDVGALVALALGAASDAAYKAVMRPVEGTILTVVRAAADGAAEACTVEGASLLDVVAAARASAAEALAGTPKLLPVLAEAGVVDAGGAGFLLLLDVVLHHLDGRPLPVPDPAAMGLCGQAPVMGTSHGEGGDVNELRYEVMYLLDAPDHAIAAFKDVWAGIGDSIVVVGGDGLWNCHIHTGDIGAAIEAAIDVGRPRAIRVTDLLEQVEEERWVREGEAGGRADEEHAVERPVPTAVVAVANGGGVRRIFHSLGVQRIVTGGQSMNPSTAQLLEAVESAPADEVVILPNNKNIIPVAEQVRGHTAKRVKVVPTRSITEAVAALVVYDPEASAEANATEMEEAAGSVVAGEVTRAVRDTTSDAGEVRQGDYIGLCGDGIRSVDRDLAQATIDLVDHLVGSDHEILTLIEGDGATTGTTRRITGWLESEHPGVRAEVLHGGQPLYPYLIGVE